MTHEFASVIFGFSDSLAILKKQKPDRKGKGQFQLGTLAREFLQEDSEKFHEAMYDVEILEKLVSKLISIDDLFLYSKSYITVLKEKKVQQNTAMIAQTLGVLARTISNGIIQKIAKVYLSYKDLEAVYQQKGPSGLKELLSEKEKNG